MKLKIYSGTHVGQKRNSNEDSLLVNENINLFVVCDGMGGHAAGEVASKIATQEVNKFLQLHRQKIESLLQNPKDHHKLVELARLAVCKACAMIFSHAQKNPECHGMGTTLSMIWLIANKAIMAHVGDSRIYLLRKNKVYQLSSDHTLQNESKYKISPAYAHILTRCLGTSESVFVDTLILDALKDDTFLLCSDGLSNYFREPVEIKNAIDIDNIDDSGEKFIQMANNKGGQDNISLILVKVCSMEDELAPAERALQILQQLPLLKGIPYRQVIRFKNSCTITQVAQGETILKKGQQSSQFYLILHGEVLVTHDNKKLTLKNGDFFGNGNLIIALESRLTAIANTNLKLLILHQDDFKKLLIKYPKLGSIIMMNMLEDFVKNHIDK